MPIPVADIRKEYKKHELNESSVKDHPVDQFDCWFRDALESEVQEVNAMTLATASSDGVPSARIVLLKGYNKNGFIFFTNYNSYKGLQLKDNPRAALVFFWIELERQVRITGLVEKLSGQQSDEYFYSRPIGSRIGAIASAQSNIISSRTLLEEKVKELSEQDEQLLKRPAHWGGYIVKPVTVEFWQGRPNRLHDRIQFSLDENGAWKKERLSP